MLVARRRSARIRAAWVGDAVIIMVLVVIVAVVVTMVIMIILVMYGHFIHPIPNHSLKLLAH